MRELARRIVEVSEKEAHRLRGCPVGFVDGAGPDVCGFEGFDQVAEFSVGGVAGIGKGLS